MPPKVHGNLVGLPRLPLGEDRGEVGRLGHAISCLDGSRTLLHAGDFVQTPLPVQSLRTNGLLPTSGISTAVRYAVSSAISSSRETIQSGGAAAKAAPWDSPP